MFLYDRDYRRLQRPDHGHAPRIAQDARYALMRYSGLSTVLDTIEAELDRRHIRIQFKTRKWGGWGVARPDRKRQKRSHRA